MKSQSAVDKKGPFSLSDLVSISGARLVNKLGDSSLIKIDNIANLISAKPTELAVLHNKKYVDVLRRSLAGACVMSSDFVEYAPESMIVLLHENPYKAFVLIAQAFYPPSQISAYRSEHAHIAKTAKVGEDCVIDYGCYIGENVVIGARTKIGVNTYIGDQVIIGDDCVIDDNVSIRHTVMGDRVIIYCGARIGQDGFGFASDRDGHYKLPHIGMVILGNDVEIGANTCIDRGSLDNTVISDHCRLDNLIQIGHNVKVGEGTVMAGQSGIAGSTEIGKFVRLGGQVGIVGHLKVGDSSTVLGSGVVIKNVDAGSTLAGYPAVPALNWHRQNVLIKRMAQKKTNSTG